MKRRLFWKLSLTIVAGTVLLFWLIHFLMLQTEHHMSHIDLSHQQTLRDYAAQAEQLYERGEMDQLTRLLRTISEKEQTWVAVVQSAITPLAGSELSPQFHEGFRLGRHVGWKIHLYFKQNPIIDLTFADGHTHFLITLPERMRPGTYWFETSLLLKLALPVLLMAILSMIIYRHVMDPLRRLEKATQQVAAGHFDVRITDSLAQRRDEITAIAETFDRMTERIGNLIESQRHLTDYLSHELRTPLTRVELAISQAEQLDGPQAPISRIREECHLMRDMVEDVLTLAWLEREQPDLRRDELDLTDLIDSVVSDARFEFSEHQVLTELPEHAPIHFTSQRILSHAIENILRNALKHSPTGSDVFVRLLAEHAFYEIQIDDAGPGVPETCLKDIFRPFFSLPQSSDAKGGFGIGLSLAKREIEAVGGQISAHNLARGLRLVIRLPSGNR